MADTGIVIAAALPRSRGQRAPLSAPLPLFAAKVAIDLLTDWGWQRSIPNYDIVHEFNIPFVRAANHVRVYGSPASVAAMDEIQEGFALLNRAKGETKLAEAYEAINSRPKRGRSQRG